MGRRSRPNTPAKGEGDSKAKNEDETKDPAGGDAVDKGESDAKVEDGESTKVEKGPQEEEELPELPPGQEYFHADLHPQYRPFFKQILTGVPRNTVEAAMTRKFLDPKYLDTPKAKVPYKGKPAHKKTALDILAEEEARQAIVLEREEKEAALEIRNPMDDIDWNAKEFKGVMGPLRKVKKYLEVKKKMIEQNAFKYGPPYNDEYGGSIIDECNKPHASTLDVHQMLLDGADPRVMDEEENFRNTPLHYACRYCHVRIAKMLHKAQCDPDKTNELGITPLGTLCMFNQPEPRHKMHLRFVTWILELGVDVNHVDKGGHTALEFAAKHGNFELVALLLRFGARVKREAEFISLSTVDLLDPEICEDMTCRQLIKAKYNEELRIEEEEKARIQKIKIDQEAKERDEERRRAIEQNRINKMNAHHEKALYEHHLEIEAMKKKKRDDARRKRMRMLEEKRNENGLWKKFGTFDWQFVEGKKEKGVSVKGDVYDNARAMNKDLEAGHSHEVMNKRWKEVTGRDLLTVKDVTDMGYGVDDMSKEERERREEEAMFKDPNESSSESEEDVNEFGLFDGKAEETPDKREGGEEKKDPSDGVVKVEKKLRRRMSITGSVLKKITLPKISAEP